MRKRDLLKRIIRKVMPNEGIPSRPEQPAPDPVVPMQSNTPPEPEPEPESEPEPEPEPEPEADEKAEKIAKHFEKTRKAMLRFLIDQDGTSHLKEMHDLSERRYFIAHRRFSDLMESLVDDALIDFSQTKNEATITDTGRKYLEE